jgi:hypothetical protein
VSAPPAETPVQELLELVVAEADATEAKRRSADLRVRAALLAWDGAGDGVRAQELIENIEHPIAPPLRLGAALLSHDDAALHACIAEARKRGDKVDLADLGSLLLWREPAQAADLLKAAGDEGLAARRLALGLAAQWAELVDALGETKPGRELDPIALVDAAQVAQDRLSDVDRARELLKKAFDKAGRAGAGAYGVERLLELGEEKSVDVYAAKLAAIDPAAAPVERAATQYLLAAAYELAGVDAEGEGMVADL